MASQPGTAPQAARPTSRAAASPRDGAVEVFGHRGACGYRPEHTLASYELAARLGADHVEPDLVPTKDGQLVCRHENEIASTTDVADRPEFADRKTTRTVDGVVRTGWFTEDFTLAELRTLRARERIPDLRPHSALHDDAFGIPALPEVLDLADRLTRELGRPIGVAPEIKHPGYFRGIGLPVEPALIAELQRRGLNRPDAAIAVQSFEIGNLRQLRDSLQVRLVQLIGADGAPRDLRHAGDPRTYQDLATPARLHEIARHADLIAPDVGLVLPESSIVADAHEAGLGVLPYTVRAENAFLPAEFRSAGAPSEHGAVLDYLEALFLQGIDAIFCDQPDLAALVRDRSLD